MFYKLGLGLDVQFEEIMGVGVGFAVAEAFDLEGAARAVVILQSAMPVAVSSYLFAQQYNRKPDEVAGMILDGDGYVCFLG